MSTGNKNCCAENSLSRILALGVEGGSLTLLFLKRGEVPCGDCRRKVATCLRPSRRRDFNLQPSDYKTDALTLSYQGSLFKCFVLSSPGDWYENKENKKVDERRQLANDNVGVFDRHASNSSENDHVGDEGPK